jgi:glycosyltransferase involved in cell wall biosynthesis
MRIGIDAHFASYELRGIGKYVLQLVSRLIPTDGSNEYVIYGDRRVFPPWMLPPSKACSQVRFRDPGGLPYPLWEQLVLPLWARQDRLELLHCPANTAPIVLPRHIKLVITVHDVMYLLPSAVLSASKVLRQQLGTFYRRRVVPGVARRADRIIAVSEFSKREITGYLRVIPDRIRVIHEGIDARFGSSAGAIALPPRKIGGESLESPFILALGADDPRKNTLAVIRVYASRWRELPHDEKLVIVGLRDWRSSAAYHLVCQLGLNKRVLFAGYVPEELLAWLYTSARCFLYPTLYEGFGFPVLEAMACGAPVIASGCTSVSEIAGDAAILVDPASEESIGNALVRLLRDEPLRRQFIQRGRARVQKFDWQDTVEKTLGVYAELSACAPLPLKMASDKPIFAGNDE